jgi:hypothetical protein
MRAAVGTVEHLAEDPAEPDDRAHADLEVVVVQDLDGRRQRDVADPETGEPPRSLFVDTERAVEVFIAVGPFRAGTGST